MTEIGILMLLWISPWLATCLYFGRNCGIAGIVALCAIVVFAIIYADYRHRGW